MQLTKNDVAQEKHYLTTISEHFSHLLPCQFPRVQALSGFRLVGSLDIVSKPAEPRWMT